VGAKAFLKLFQTYSNSKVFFPAFKETPLENLTLNEALQNHGLKLVKVRSWGRCYDHNFRRFSTIFGDFRQFSQNQCNDQMFA
jgi:hypothetical protein